VQNSLPKRSLYLSAAVAIAVLSVSPVLSPSLSFGQSKDKTTQQQNTKTFTAADPLLVFYMLFERGYTRAPVDEGTPPNYH